MTDEQCPGDQTCVAQLCELPGGGDHADANGHLGDGALGGGHDASPDAEGPAGPNGWHAATHVPGVNTASTETQPAYTEDQLTIVFASDRSGGTGGLDLYIGTRNTIGDAFTVRELTELNSTADDQSPEISQDGTIIFFVTNRSGNGMVYSASRASTAAVFGAPANVPTLSKDHTGANQNNVAIAVTPDLTEAIVMEQKSTTDTQAEGFDRPDTSSTWTDEENLSAVASFPPGLTESTLTDDAAIIYYESGTPAQIYLTSYTESSDTFSAPVAITELNLGTRDGAPSISAGGSHLVFERDGDLFEATK